MLLSHLFIYLFIYLFSVLIYFYLDLINFTSVLVILVLKGSWSPKTHFLRYNIYEQVAHQWKQ